MFLLQAIQDIFQNLCRAFLIFPQFNFGNGLIQLARSNIEVQILSGYGIDAYKDPFSLEGLGWMFISSIIQGIVFFTLRLLLNKTVIRKVRWGKQKPEVVFWCTAWGHFPKPCNLLMHRTLFQDWNPQYRCEKCYVDKWLVMQQILFEWLGKTKQ